MGIRYYAYAFDRDLTEQALADPRSLLSSDPFADAWGMEPHASFGVATMKQRTPERDFLYLDKAWPLLQQVTRPQERRTARPSHRMFEGNVSMRGYGWDPWLRTLRPDEMDRIARDLREITDEYVAARLRSAAASGRRLLGDLSYALDHLRAARTFVDGLAAEERGMVYMIC